MSSSLVPSNPEEVMVIRDLTPRVVTLSVPFARGGKIKFGGRATIVKLTMGTLAVFSPVALTDTVREKILSMGGTVSHIIAPDLEHHIFVSDWKAAFPSAKLIGPAGLPEKRAKQALTNPSIPKDERWDVLFDGPTKATTRVDEAFDADFDYEFVDGHANHEIVLFFKPERILIEADLLFNLPATEQYSRVPGGVGNSLADRVALSTNTTTGDLKWVRRWIWYVVSARDRSSFNESVKRIATWDFGTVIPCHGDVMEGEEGKAAFMRVLQWHLEGKHH
jgi:glyoxylase-like metal-dependent hydrolase (beta-lactamase superfamily II)